jgi:hypothetical protein
MRKTVISRRAMLGAGACGLAAAATIAEIEISGIAPGVPGHECPFPVAASLLNMAET